VQTLERRALDQELEVRRRRIDELQRLKPEPEWVANVRRRIEENKQNPRVTVGGEVVSERKKPTSDLSIDFRPHVRAHFEIRLLGQTAYRIIDHVNEAGPYGPGAFIPADEAGEDVTQAMTVST
jgi:hypothetical protein